MAGTPQFVKDRHRGLYSYEPLRSRLETRNSFLPGRNLPPGTLIHLKVLTVEEIFVLLKRILEIYYAHWEMEGLVSDKDLEEFINQIVNKLGAQELLTPREIVRDFLTILDLVRVNPDLKFLEIVNSSGFVPSKPGPIKNDDLVDIL